MKPKVLVTGATGKTGTALVAELRKHEWPVKAMVSREDARSNNLRKLGAEVVVADMYDPEQLYVALRGTTRAYYLPLMRPYMIQAANAFAVAAREAKLEFVVQMSQWSSCASHPTAMTRQTWLIDRVFSMIPGVAHTIFNPGMFADNFLRMMDFAALLGIFPVLMGESQCAPISNEDMARCAAAILMGDPATHAGRSYRPTGPQLLSGTDIARSIGGAVGHRVLPINLPIWLFLKVARMQHVDPYEIYLFIRYIEDNKQGTYSYLGGVTHVMEQLTGKPAERFDVTASRYAQLPFAAQTATNRLKALLRFVLTPFYPAYDVDAYERRIEVPPAAKPLYCMEDPRWKEARKAQMSEAAEPLGTLADSYSGQDTALTLVTI